MIKVLRSPGVHLFICGDELVGSRYFEFLWELAVEVRPRQASVLACVVLAGTSEGTSESKSSSVNFL